MRLKSLPFFISLALLVCLIALLPLIFDGQLTVSGSGAMMGLVPTFGLAVVLATCTLGDQAGSRGIVFVPVATLLGISMAVLCWVFASFVGANPFALTLGYGFICIAGAYAFLTLVRKLYDVKVSNRKVLPTASLSAVPALVLLFFPLTLYSHSAITAAWVACVGVGIAFISIRRKRSVVTGRKLDIDRQT